MFTTFLKILAFVAVVTGLTWGAVQLLDMRGGANVSVAGYEVTLNALQLVFAFVALIVVVWLALKVLTLLGAVFRFLNGDETAISRHFDRNRERNILTFPLVWVRNLCFK